MKFAKSLFLTIILCIFMFAINANASSTLYNSLKQSNISYGTHPRQILDLAVPCPNNGNLVIYVHGGYFLIGDKSAITALNPDSYLKKGISVATLNYRYLNQAVWPAQIYDVAAGCNKAVEKLIEQGVIVGDITLHGYSAGAIAGALLLYTDDFASVPRPNITKFVGVSGLYNPYTVNADTYVQVMLSYGFNLLYIPYSDLNHVKALILQGTHDSYDTTMGYKPNYVYWFYNAHANYLANSIKVTGGSAKTIWILADHNIIYLNPVTLPSIYNFIIK